MKKSTVYIIDSRIDFRNICALNLIVYINADIRLLNNFDELNQVLETGTPDAICIYLDVKEEDKIFHLTQALKKIAINPIIIFQSKSKNIPKEYITYETNIPIKSLVQSIAKDLNITAKDMASINFGDHYPIPTDFILPGWQIRLR